MRIILASQSPRRRELLERMGLGPFEIVPALGEERAGPSLSPAQLVEATRAKLTAAEEKAAKIRASIAALG